MNSIIDNLFKRNEKKSESINEGYIKDKKTLDKLCDDFMNFLKKKKFNSYDELGVDHGGLIATVDGDWKHEHLYFKNLVKDFFEKDKGYSVHLRSDVTNDTGSDYYGALYRIEIMESAVSEDAIISDTELQDVPGEEAYNAFLDVLEANLDESTINKFDILVNKFSNTPINNIAMTKIEPMSGFAFDLTSKLIAFVLKDGLATEPDVNKGLVIVITLPSGVMHLIDTEVLDDTNYNNTVLYNMHQLEAISKEMWIGDVDLK